MCSYCNSIPHHPRCPLASEPKPVHICQNCGASIYAWEDTYDIHLEPENDETVRVCSDCLYDLTAWEDTADLEFERVME